MDSNEWQYLLLTRETPSGIRFAKAKVNDVYGLIILPDDWNSEYYDLKNTNKTNVSYTTNVISLSDWNSAFESHGAVFLPVTGVRSGQLVSEENTAGHYWSTLNYCALIFNGSSLIINTDVHTYQGRAVRLVQTVE